MIRTYSWNQNVKYVEEFKRRDISKSQFCREKDISATTFRDWLRQDQAVIFGEKVIV